MDGKLNLTENSRMQLLIYTLTHLNHVTNRGLWCYPLIIDSNVHTKLLMQLIRFHDTVHWFKLNLVSLKQKIKHC